jgi:NADP-dependent 3-hydroxy acid dehydrogenase YdfG
MPCAPWRNRCARELGPQNIHVAHVVIDGAIDTEWIKTNFPERYNAGPDAVLAGPDAVLNPDDIAEVYWQIHQQKRSAWTFEMDLRPWKETW